MKPAPTPRERSAAVGSRAHPRARAASRLRRPTWPLLRPYAPRVALLALFIFTGTGLRLAYPQVVRFFIDTAREGGALEDLMWAAGVYLAIGVGRQFIFLSSSYLGQDVGEKEYACRGSNWHTEYGGGQPGVGI